MASDPVIHRIDEQLKKYYESVNAEYQVDEEGIGLFALYCDENDIHDGDINDELSEDPTDCILVEFDDKFPLSPPPKNETDRAEQIFAILKMCYDGGVTDTAYPAFNKQLYDVITSNDVQQIKATYKEQCPAIYNAGMENDEAFSRIAAVGHKHEFDYLQHLVDAFYRDTVKDISTSLNVDTWVKRHKHFIELKALSKKSANEMPFNPHEMAKSAVAGFSTRGCPKLMFTNTVEINGCLKTTVQYIVAMIEWIGHMIKKETGQQAVCPFQVDLCLAFGAPQNKEHMELLGFNGDDIDDANEEDDDDDDDDDVPDYTVQKKGAFVDMIGDIRQKLDTNKLKYTLKTNDEFKEPNSRLLDEVFNEFKSTLDAEEKKQSYPLKSRWVTFVDGRSDINSGDIWMYSPPDDCRKIPSNAVPEWYIGASKQCLLPNLSYGDGKKESQPEGSKSNIKSTTHCHGALLTLSIIAREQDVIKAYLYWYGQIIRFEPEDIRTVLPKLFNMKWNGGKELEDNEMSINEQFLAKSNVNVVNQLIDQMKQVMIDKPFQGFVQKYK